MNYGTGNTSVFVETAPGFMEDYQSIYIDDFLFSFSKTSY